jgi:hypothetical protein
MPNRRFSTSKDLHRKNNGGRLRGDLTDLEWSIIADMLPPETAALAAGRETADIH